MPNLTPPERSSWKLIDQRLNICVNFIVVTRPNLLFRIVLVLWIWILQSQRFYAIADGIASHRRGAVFNAFTVTDINLTFFPTPQYLSENSRTMLGETISSFVKVQLLSLYNQSSYQLNDAGISITDTFARKNNCRHLKWEFTPKRHRIMQQVEYEMILILKGFLQFQDYPIPDGVVAMDDFISVMSNVTLLLEYIQHNDIPQLQYVTSIAFAGKTFSYQNDDHNHNVPCTGNNIPRPTKNIIIGVCTCGGIALIAGLGTAILLRSRRKRWGRIKKRGRVIQIKHLSDEDSMEFQDGTYSGKGNNQKVLFTLNNKAMDEVKHRGNDSGKERPITMSDAETLRSDLNMENRPEYLFKAIDATINSSYGSMDESDRMTSEGSFPVNFDSSSVTLRAVSPLPPGLLEEGHFKHHSTDVPSESTVKTVDTNLYNIGAFPTRLSQDSVQDPQRRYSGAYALETDSSVQDSGSFYNQSLTSGHSRIHPLDWSLKGSTLDGQSIGNSTLTDAELFVVRRTCSPTILEHYNELGFQGNGQVDGETNTRPATSTTELQGSKQFVNDLVWLKQKLSNVRGDPYDDNSSKSSDD